LPRKVVVAILPVFVLIGTERNQCTTKELN
jgi:hypothetical protein